MAQQKPHDPAEFIRSLNMNGLQGRMLRLPAANPSNKKEILIVYGHHALLERWWGLAQAAADYGTVTMPDLPGFGGMDSFYKIGKRPTIDNFADYLAAFIKLRYKRRRITVMGVSFGFVVITRMLQRYPDLAKRVDVAVSLVGFIHSDNFLFAPRQRRMFSIAARAFAWPPVAFFIRHGCLNKLVLTQLYVKLPAAKRRFLDTPPDEFARMLDFEVKLWQANDVRTHWLTTSEFLHLDNTRSSVAVPVWHIASKNDHYFNNISVEQHMRRVFSQYHAAQFTASAHTPSVLASKAELGVMLPRQLRRYLAGKA